ncbi:MAG: hypothetical protein MHMPM18_004401 [Marteilia pararefringens]
MLKDRQSILLQLITRYRGKSLTRVFQTLVFYRQSDNEIMLHSEQINNYWQDHIPREDFKVILGDSKCNKHHYFNCMSQLYSRIMNSSLAKISLGALDAHKHSFQRHTPRY